MSDDDAARDAAGGGDSVRLPSIAGGRKGEVVISLQREGILVGGDPDAVESYVDRIRETAGHVIAIADVDTSSVANVAGVAAGVAGVLGQAGQFVQLHPESMQAIKHGNLVPGTDGFFRMTLAGADGKFLQQLQWRPAGIAPTQLLSLQMIAVQIALSAAIAEVNDSIQRVEGKVDALLKLVEAQRDGDVMGHKAAVDQKIRYLEKNGALPTAYWEEVAGLGPTLVVTVERLRAHVRRVLRDFDPKLPVQERAEILHRAVDQEQIGETLSLLVIAEDSLYKWQRLSLAQVEATSPDHLEKAIQAARDFLTDQFEQDGELYTRAHAVLGGFAQPNAIDGFRYWSVRRLARDRAKLRTDLDAFARARCYQVADWKDSETPGVLDAASAAVDQAANAAGQALTAAGEGLKRLGDHLTEPPREKDAVAQDEPDTPNTSVG